MKNINIGIIGLGTVGSGVVNTILQNKNYYKKEYAVDFNIVIASVKNLTKPRNCDCSQFILTDNAHEVISNSEVEIVIELMGGIDKSFELISTALTNKKNIITANKALIAELGQPLFDLAKSNDCKIHYEAAVAGGIPIIKNICDSLTANPVEWIAGIINGTSNYILTQMQQPNAEFTAILKQAQELGYAEADPTFDIEGIDAAHKLLIMASLAFNCQLDFADIYIEGISNITSSDIQNANVLGYQIKHLGIAKKTDDKIELRVQPTLVSNINMMSHVNGVSNAIMVHNTNAGSTLFSGAGAGSYATASAVIADLLDLALERSNSKLLQHNNPITTVSINNIASAYYLSMKVIDKAGTLAKITDIFGHLDISVEQLHQDHNEDNSATLVMITNKTIEHHIKEATAKIEQLGLLENNIKLIRVLEL